MSRKALLIIALSARPYAQAAVKAGYKVTVIDAFLDMETIEASSEAFTVSIGPQGFDDVSLLARIKALTHHDFIGCIVGSGFEMQPNLLHQITEYMPLLGNRASVVDALKNPNHFFGTLSELKIPYPALLAVEARVPSSGKPSVLKQIGGSGGQHIAWYVDPCEQTSTIVSQLYQQTFIEGDSVSVLFLAKQLAQPSKNQQQAVIIGYNEQWLSPTVEKPFRFGGVVSQLPLSQSLKTKLQAVVASLTAHYGLVGLNSLDVVVADGEIYVLEINPRLSLSLDLYLDDWIAANHVNLIEAHIGECLLMQAENDKTSPVLIADQKASNRPLAQPSSKAISVVYAENTTVLNADVNWPSWVVDRPSPIDRLTAVAGKTVVFEKGEPICSVVAKGNDNVSTKKLAQLRVAQILNMLN